MTRLPYDGDLHVEPACCPEALVTWYQFGSKRSSTIKNKGDLSMRAKKHLAYLGWDFKYIRKRSAGRELRYIAPGGKIFNTLKLACEYCIEKKGYSIEKEESSVEKEESSMEKEESSTEEEESRMEKEESSTEEENSRMEKEESSTEEEESDGISIDVPPLECIVPEEPAKPISIETKRAPGRPRKYPPDNAQQKKKLTMAASVEAVSNIKKRGRPRKDDQKQNKRRKKFFLASTQNETIFAKQQKNVSKEEETNPSGITSISQLIEWKVVPQNAEVHYMDADAPLKRGNITRDGNVLCSCCDQKFDLKDFEVHAGGTFSKPALCIFLEDKSSLLKLKNDKIDGLCSICHEGGEMIICDRCPSTFHQSCLGLEKLPHGNWFCPCCTCSICGKSHFNQKGEFAENSSLVCYQCKHEFHVGCLRREGFKQFNAGPEDNWFCSSNCKKIFGGLQRMLGKAIPIENSDVNNLSWTILKYNSHDMNSMNSKNSETMMEFHAKLNVALSIMHGNFEPIYETFTNSDLIEDVIFSRVSKLNRLNFQGFYTILLEKEDDVICVATLRVHGEKVAEVPLIATSPNYLRQGMCRRLMDEIEKMLVEFGVKRLILPAAGQALSMWIDHLGFSEMTHLERMKFLSYTFLHFPKATMCQKTLTKNQCHKSSSFVRYTTEEEDEEEDEEEWRGGEQIH